MFAVDTPVSKKNHDASPKHQGSLKRFLRDLHRANEREQTAAESAKREVARLNALVGGPGSSSSAGASSFTGPSSLYKQAPRATNEEERKRQLKELEALGVALPDEARRELAMVGDWEETSVEARRAGSKKMTEKEMVQIELAKQQKRKFEQEEKERKWNAMDEDEKAMRGFSIQTKTYPGQDEGAGKFDPGMLFKGKGREKAPEVIGKEDEQVKVKEEEVHDDALATCRAEEDAGAASVKREQDETEEINVNVKLEEGVVVKKEDSEAAAVSEGIVFKKRKVKHIRKR